MNRYHLPNSRLADLAHFVSSKRQCTEMKRLEKRAVVIKSAALKTRGGLRRTCHRDSWSGACRSGHIQACRTAMAGLLRNRERSLPPCGCTVQSKKMQVVELAGCLRQLLCAVT